MPWLVGPAATSQETFSFFSVFRFTGCDVSFVLVPLVRELFLSPLLVWCEHSLVQILGLPLVSPCDSALYRRGDDVVSWRHLRMARALSVHPSVLCCK